MRNPTSYTGVPRFDSRPQGQLFVTSFVFTLYDSFQEKFAIIPQVYHKRCHSFCPVGNSQSICFIVPSKCAVKKAFVMN